MSTTQSGHPQLFEEGDIFVVPLDDGRHTLGLLARKTRSATALGYFFDLRIQAINAIESKAGLAASVIYVSRFSALGLRDGTWTVVGHLKNWTREEWPVPAFGHVPVHERDLPSLRSYDDRTLKFSGEEICSKEVALKAPPDGLAGSGFIEKRLARLISTR
ncbi:MAG TPA: Imm26 family immunity protein [Jatrophihabitans sp.]|nr:Imm26 family immunity protein [Jatrophihabitans sp.]